MAGGMYTAERAVPRTEHRAACDPAAPPLGAEPNGSALKLSPVSSVIALGPGALSFGDYIGSSEGVSGLRQRETLMCLLQG